ncbi:MAG TPA: phenylalanine--tRNA ligase subunit alpha, partial [Gammaproteobacteria bacterium]|nr:phenylalanine--tRNA ligase subunit alpha [Gammaproteobacteria bacterium]
MSSIAQLLEQAESAVSAACDLAELDAIRVKYLGKKGLFTLQLRELGKLPAELIPVAGKEINTAKESLAAAIEARKQGLE